MKRLIFSCCFFISIHACFAQQTFPDAFVGQWEGTLDWNKAGSHTPKQVKMHLNVSPNDTGNTYKWQIIYGDKSEDNRPYILKPVDTTKGHWQIDERNGIVIDQYWVGERFTSAFTVQTNTIICSYYLQDGNLVAEFNSITTAPVSKTGKGTGDSPAVTSYGVKSFQKAILKKVGREKAPPVKPLAPYKSQ